MGQDRGPELRGIAIGFLVTAWIAMLARAYVRAILIRSFGVDDWVMSATLTMFTIYTSFVFLGVHYGTGQHVADLTIFQSVHAMKAWYMCEWAYVSASTLLKLAIASFYLRIAVKPFHKYIIYGVMMINIIFGLAYVSLVIFQCHPVDYFWIRMNGSLAGHCITTKAIVGATYAHSAISAASDWTLGVLPILLMWDVQMSLRLKITVGLIMSLGAVASVSTLIRIKFVGGLSNENDFLWYTTDVAIWSTVEPGVGILAGCLATLRPLLRLFLSKTGLTSAGGTKPLSSGSQARVNKSTRSGGPWKMISRNADRMDRDMELTMRPDDLAQTTTTIGRSESRAWDKYSDSDRSGSWPHEAEQPVQYEGKINKVVQITTSTETRDDQNWR